MPDALRLSAAQLESILGHAGACKPEEACGILAGSSDGRVERVFLMENSQHSQTFYVMDSGEQFQVFDEMESESMELVGIFHSHPHSAAYPSSQDVDLAFYPDSIYLIVSLMNAEPEAHAFRIQDRKIREIAIIVDGNDA